MTTQTNLNLNDKTPETYQLEKPRAIKGYPELYWQGKRPFTSTQFYPALQKEEHGQPTDGWINQKYWATTCK